MPAKKRQHFVPVFYLKFFSTHPVNETISLFHLASQRLISDVAIRRQAYKDYFYGSDKVLEDAFEALETRCAEVIKDLIARNAHPKYLSSEHQLVLTFTITLHSRTLYSAEELNESIEQLIKHVFPNDPKAAKEHLDQLKLELQSSPQRAIANAASMISLVSDLGFKLLVNRTATPFLTSDHPVVFYNQFFETRRPWGSNTGFASKGLQIFLPISPGHCLIFYDQAIYKVGGKTHRPINVLQTSDIDAINGLQYLNAHKTLYFNNHVSDSYVRSLVARNSAYLRKTKSNIREYEGGTTADGNHESLIHTFKEDVRCRLSLSIVQLTPVAKRFRLDNRAVYHRDDMAVHLYTEFMSAVAKGAYSSAEFDKFIIDKLQSANAS